MKKSIFVADSNHLHHRLLKLGWSQKMIAIFYYFTTVLIALVALSTRTTGKIVAFAMFVIIATMALFAISKKTQELENNAK